MCLLRGTDWVFKLIQFNFRLINADFAVMFMVTVNYHHLMGFDVNGRPNPGKKTHMVRNLHTCGLNHRVLKTVHIFFCLLYPEDVRHYFPSQRRQYLSVDTESHQTRLKSSATPLQQERGDKTLLYWLFSSKTDKAGKKNMF